MPVEKLEVWYSHISDEIIAFDIGNMSVKGSDNKTYYIAETLLGLVWANKAQLKRQGFVKIGVL